MVLHRALLPLVAATALSGSALAQVVNSEWNTGNGNWNVAGNWFPNDVPDNGGGFTYNVQIGNRPVAAGAQVTFVPEDGSGDTIQTLTVSSGADLLTNGNQLNVNGQVVITGASSSVRVDPHNTPGNASIQWNDLDLTAGGALQMSGGVANVFFDMDVTTTGVLAGFGTLNVGDLDLAAEQAFQNSGVLQVSGNSFGPSTLTIHANGADTIDLDGDVETGDILVSNAVANVNADTLTLVIDGPLTDGLGAAAGGTLEIGQRDTVTFNRDFEIDAGFAITMNGGNAVATINGPGVITDVAGAAFTITGDAVIENAIAFTGTTNVVTVNANSSLTFGGVTTVADASMITLGSNAELVITGVTTITEAAGDFNWDGANNNATTTVRGNTALLTINVDQIDAGNDIFNGTITLVDGGDLTVLNTVNTWQAAGVVNKNGTGTSMINGDEFAVTGDLNVNAGTLDVNAAAIFGTTSDVVIAAGATADMGTTKIFNGADITVNGTLSLGANSILEAPATLTGTGLLRLNSTSTVLANAVVNTASFDWDGLGAGSSHTINNGVVFTINSTVWDADDGGDVDDNINLGGNGAQIVVNNVPGWTMARTLNANTAAAGTATIGGASNLAFAGASSVLNVDGNTNIVAPVVFGGGSTVSIDAGMTLDLGATASYAGGTIGGAGTFSPAVANTVTATSTINATNFDFDAGNWTIQSGAQLTVNVTDYDVAVASNTLDSTVTLNNGVISVTTGDAEFVMDGALNMNASGGVLAQWLGDPVDIGNDAGALDADLNVTGDGNPNSQARFGAPVDFNSDADVNVAAGGTLVFNSSVDFNTVNGGNNAEFTGAGAMVFNGLVNVNETVTLNMVGGRVDLDGVDSIGDFINIDAPLTVNAAGLVSFGKSNVAGVNTLDINNSVGTGVLIVNLDDPAAAWTLNSQGVMNLVNDNSSSVLLAGSAAVLNGTVNVTGDVQTTARVEIGGTTNINTAGEQFRLVGGDNAASQFNLIAGGVINGPGRLGAASGRSLHGFGTINADIDFDGAAHLRASGGTLTINGAIIDVGEAGADAGGTLHVANAWNTIVATGVVLRGGTMSGEQITNDAPAGISGDGLVTAKVVNNAQLAAGAGQHLIFNTPGHDNDWDGAMNNGALNAVGGTLELLDNAVFGFSGAASASAGGRIFTNGFGMSFSSSSTINLTGGALESTSSTAIHGTLNVMAGQDSTLQVANNFFLTFEPTSVISLAANLRTVNNNIVIKNGAAFSGAGALVVPEGSHLVVNNQADVGVLLDMHGTLRPGNAVGIGRANLVEYQQGDTGALHIDIIGTSLNEFDRLVVSGDAVVDGRLDIHIEEISPGVPFVPVSGNTFNIITANSVTGTFDFADVTGMPTGLAFHINYLPNAVQLQVVTKPVFSADFDDDGDVDPVDLQIWRDAFNLNQLGDADGDIDSDGDDFLAWQRQFGSTSAALVVEAVPEPASALLLLGAVVMTGRRLGAAQTPRRRIGPVK